MTIQEDFLMRPATLDDAEIVAALLNEVLEAQVGARTHTDEMVRNDWQSPGFKLEDSIRLFINEAGYLVGEVSIWDTSALPVQVWLGLNIHPDFIDAPFTARMLRWAETRARQAMARVPETARVVAMTGAHHSEAAKQSLLATHGFKQVRRFHTMRIDMTAPPPQPTLPDGICIRQFERQQDMDAAMAAMHESFHDHWGVLEPLEEAVQYWTHWMNSSKDYDPSLWFLAVEGEEIVGLALCSTHAYDDPDAGFVMEMAVRRPWRRRGIATALLNHSFGAFWRRGIGSVMLGVDAGSLTGATQLYENVGMRVVHVWNTFEKELRPGEDLSKQSLD